MVVAIAVTTAPRPKPTLGPALASLRQAGYHEPVVVVTDGDVSPQIDFRCAMVRTSRPGLLGTWAHALTHLLESTSADLLLVMQDDVTWPAGAWPEAIAGLGALAAYDPGFGYASLHTMPRVQVALETIQSEAAIGPWHATRQLEPHLYKGRWCGAQCWALSRESARQLLADREFLGYIGTTTRGFDHQATATLNRMRRTTYTWWPSLLSHDLGKGNRAPRRRAA